MALLNSDMSAGDRGPGWRRQLNRVVNDALNLRIIGGGFPTSGTGTPKHNHDRCERSVQMRLYTLSKGHFALVFAIFLLVFVILLMIGLAGPPITSIRQRRASELPDANTTNLATGPLVVLSPMLSTYCQQLWVIVRLFVQDPAQNFVHETYDTTFQISSKTFASTTIDNAVDVEKSRKLANTDVNKGRNRTAVLHCHDANCDEMIVARLGFIEYRQYYFVFRIYGLTAFDQRFSIKDIVFYFKSYNPSFSRLELWFRFIFVAFALCGTLWFYQSLRAYPIYLWSIEQKWLALLLPLLLLYNNPLFPLVFVMNNALPRIIDASFQATFLCALLLFWLCIYHGIKQTNRPWLKFYLPKLVLVFLLWITAIGLSIFESVAALRDSDTEIAYDISHAKGLKIFFYVIGSLYLAYLAILIGRAYRELRNLSYFDTRLKFFTLFLFIVIVVTTIITVLRFGIMPTLEDTFMSHLSTTYGSSAEFMAFYGLLNCYILTMAFVYSPNPNVIAELQFSEPSQPSASALLNNDSEDELYGPELSAKSLRPHFGEDESDGD